MAKTSLPTPSIEITKTEARRFMLAHHGLYPPRQLTGKEGVLKLIRRFGCIQFDPINIVGRNPDLVLQSRVKDYKPSFLDELLYEDRCLIDGWDKMASIYAADDWPYFSRRRDIMNQPNVDSRRPPQKVLDDILQEVRERGPVSSLDFKENEIIDWHWGPTKIVRAALESLFSMSKVGVHHRVNNRRAFDILERLLPKKLLDQPDPFATEQDYQDWHILRRVGGMGLAHPKSGEYWLGILSVKSKERRAALNRLTEHGGLTAVSIAELPGQIFFIRKIDFPALINIQSEDDPKPGAAFIAALDNLTWNRWLVQQIFDFKYIWEVYKPQAKREYGYYVLPVIYGDRFVGRFDPKFDKKKKILTIQNWWWESDVQPNKDIQSALLSCLTDFVTYLDAQEIDLGESIQDDKALQWIKEVIKK